MTDSPWHQNKLGKNKLGLTVVPTRNFQHGKLQPCAIGLSKVNLGNTVVGSLGPSCSQDPPLVATHNWSFRTQTHRDYTSTCTFQTNFDLQSVRINFTGVFKIFLAETGACSVAPDLTRFLSPQCTVPLLLVLQAWTTMILGFPWRLLTPESLEMMYSRYQPSWRPLERRCSPWAVSTPCVTMVSRKRFLSWCRVSFIMSASRRPILCKILNFFSEFRSKENKWVVGSAGARDSQLQHCHAARPTRGKYQLGEE